MADALLTEVGLLSGLMSIPAMSNFTLNASTDQLEWIFQAQDDLTITRLLFRYGVRTGTPPTFIISLQGVGTTGNPDGTIKGGGSPASKTFTPPADTTWNSTYREITLDNAYAATAGEWLAIVIAYSSGTIDGSNNSSFTSVFTNMSTRLHPYAIENDAGVRARSSHNPNFAYGTAGAVYGTPLLTGTFTNFSSATTPDEYGVKFTIPADWCATYKIVGVLFGMSGGAGATALIQLYDSDGTSVLQNVTYDGDYVRTAASDSITRVYFDETTLATLTAGTTYRIGIAPQSATAWTFQHNAVGDASHWNGWNGGTNFAYTTRTDAGAWTDTTTTRPSIALILADITEPASGGGGLPGNVSGGIFQ